MRQSTLVPFPPLDAAPGPLAFWWRAPSALLLPVLLLPVLLLLPAGSADAQLAQQLFQVVIERVGADCKQVEKTQAIGTGSNGDALVAVACTGGGQHVVRIHPNNSLSYMTSCAELKTRTGIGCFDADPAR